LRQYLWAHRRKDVQRAQTLVRVLPEERILAILQYLVESYWQRYCGWPDLLVFGPERFEFIEVKLGGDQLSQDQKQWIRGNASSLRLPFRIAKVHRSR
jgi:hypothetical protein